MPTETLKAKRNDLVYPDLCYQVVGALFDVYNKLGYVRKESYYQKAVALKFKELEIKFSEQVYAPLIFQNKITGRNYFDFLVENKMIIELKRGTYFSKSHIDQVYNYLKTNNLKLGLLVYFSSDNLHYKRIVNLDD